MSNKFLYIFTLLFFMQIVNAQESIESLNKILSNKNTTSFQKTDLLCDLSVKFRGKDSIIAYKYAYKALELAQNTNSKLGQTIALANLSKIFHQYSKVQKQSYYADKSYSFALQSNSEEAMAYANCALAEKFAAIGDDERYLTLMLKSLAYFEKTKTRYDKLVNGYENVGAHFGDLNNNVLRKKYVKKALDLANESKNPINIANALTSWGLYLEDFYTKESPENSKLLDSSENCYLMAIRLFEENNEQLNYSYGRTCLNLSSLYVYHFYDTRTTKTLEYLNKSEKVCSQIDSSMQLMILCGQKTQYYTYKNDIPKIISTLATLENKMAKQKNIEPRYKMILNMNYMDLATLQNDFVAYRSYFTKYDEAISEMINKENRKREINATIRFEAEQKDTQIQSLSENLKTKNKINYLYGSLFVLALVSLIFMFSTYNFRQKAYIKANLLLQKANDEAQLLSKLKDEETMNAMLESELSEKKLQIVIQEKILTQQQKAKLQQELMTNNLQLERKNEVLKEIKEKLLSIKSERPSEIKSISKTIDKSLETDEEFELLKTSFEHTNPIFFETIQEKATGTLSKLDFKYCGYIKLGMSTKEIANHMNIEAQSMRMARYRIKQKLNLNKDEDLDSYIRQI